MAAVARTALADVEAFIAKVNVGYEKVHRAFENQFWGTKMALAGPAPEGTPYSTEELTRTKAAMESFLADESVLSQARAFLATPDLPTEHAKTLRIFERTVQCYVMPNADAKALREGITAMEGTLEAARNTLQLGYTDLVTKQFKQMSSVGLRNVLRASADEATRKAAYTEGLEAIGRFVVANGFPAIVTARNKLAKSLGYLDFYDYKVTQAEGFGKVELFKILDTLKGSSDAINTDARARLAAEKGSDALLPWNTPFALAGDVTKELDPYFPFATAVERWGRSYARMGIAYNGATMNLDLLDRKHKYSNGFCHWPVPAWRRADGSWQPSTANFTSLADPAAVGSGLTALTTLMHEAGHAAHFANIDQPSPLFSQERAPTSVAYAENQSMFLDSLVTDAAWRSRYAKSLAGETLPWALHEKDLTAKHPYEVFMMRAMLAVPYFEKALYELPDADVTAERITTLAQEVELALCGGPSSRPLLSVPHILSDESSCYYHGYVLAEMSVRQTRHHFLKSGEIVDNPAVGAALRDVYWRPGNSRVFLDLVQEMTGAPLTGDAWVADLKQPLAELLSEEKKAYDAGLAVAAGRTDDDDVDLKMHVRLVDGDTVIADSVADGSFLNACAKFRAFVDARVAATKSA